MNLDRLLFYDIECFRYDSLIVFKTLGDECVPVCIWNDEEHLENHASELSALIAGWELAGYNNYYYDDQMLFMMLKGVGCDVLKKRNDRLIHGDALSEETDGRHQKSGGVWMSYDVMQQIDVSKPSLKQIEGNMGISIEETEIPFDIDRPLTEEEKRLTERYCEHDVDATIEVFKKREKSYFQAKEYIAKMLCDENNRFDMNTVMRWNTTSIVGFLLKPEHQNKWPRLGFGISCWKSAWRSVEGITEDIWEMWETANTEENPKGNGIEKQLLGCTISFGFGGLHGVGSKKRYGKVKLLDVASMYPSIMINMEALGDKTERYKAIKADRIEAKHSGDKLRSDALKLILNSTYGLLKNEYSPLYNPKASSSVCIYGQIAAFDLAKRLYDAGYELVNINTDGVAFADNGTTEYEGIWKEWEHDYNLTLECDDFDRWVQKDVNNYIASHDGKIKTKGGEVGKYQKENLFSNNSCRIVNIVLTEKLIDPEQGTVELLKKHRDEEFNPTEWMYILKAGRTYSGVWDKMTDTKQQNVNRVFAVLERYADVDLYKKRMDDGIVRFPDAPAHMKLWNKDCSEIDHAKFKKQIDIGHYAKIVDKKLEEWK